MIQQNLSRVEVELLTIQYRFNTKKSYHESRRISDGIIYYITGGHRINNASNQHLEASEGDLLFIPCCLSYDSIVTAENTEYYEIDYQLYQNGKPVRLMEESCVIKSPDSHSFLPLIKGAYDAFIEQSTVSRFKCVSNVFQLCAMLLDNQSYTKEARADKDVLRRIRRTVDYIRNHFDEGTSVKDLAALSELCVSTVDRHFLSCLGMTPVEYRNCLRVEHAKMLLLGGFSVSNVCSKVGFSDYNYFIRVFKKITGKTPSQFSNEMWKDQKCDAGTRFIGQAGAPPDK